MRRRCSVSQIQESAHCECEWRQCEHDLFHDSAYLPTALPDMTNTKNYTPENRLRPLKPPKIQQKVFVPLTDEEIAKLLRLFNPREPFGARNYAIFVTLLDCGLRASELCNLKLSDAELEQGCLKVLGKGDKERFAPIGHACQEALLRWRSRYRPMFNPCADRLFLATDGGPLSLNALGSLVRKSGARGGIDRLHCHLLHPTFATSYLVKQIGDPLRLQQILGHTSLEMVRRYVSVASVQRSLIDRRSSAMDLLLSEEPLRNRHATRRQAQGDRGFEGEDEFLAPRTYW